MNGWMNGMNVPSLYAYSIYEFRYMRSDVGWNDVQKSWICLPRRRLMTGFEAYITNYQLGPG